MYIYSMIYKNIVLDVVMNWKMYDMQKHRFKNVLIEIIINKFVD